MKKIKAHDLKKGQKFKSQSKIQKTPISYIFGGFMENGDCLLLHDSKNPMLDCEVDPLWFNERKITLIS